MSQYQRLYNNEIKQRAEISPDATACIELLLDMAAGGIEF